MRLLFKSMQETNVCFGSQKLMCVVCFVAIAGAVGNPLGMQGAGSRDNLSPLLCSAVISWHKRLEEE